MKNITDMTKPITDIDGTAIVENGEPVLVGKLLARVVARGLSEDPVRAMSIALRLYNANGKGVELEDADALIVQACVRNDRSLSNLAKAALLTAVPE